MFFCTNSNIWIVDAAPHSHSSILSVYRMALLHHGCWVVKPFIHSKNRICETCNILPPSSDIPSHPVRPHFPFQAIHQRVSSEWVAHVWRNTTIWYENVAIIIYHHFATHRVASQHLTHSTSVQIPTHRIHHKHILSLQAVRASIACPGADTLLQIRIQLADVRCTYIR